MRTSFFAVFLLLVGGALPAIADIEIQHWQTSSGVRVYFVPAPELPMLDLRLLFDAGAVHDGKQYGIAQLTNRLLAQGAAGMSADQISFQFESLGAEFAASAGYDFAALSLRTLTYAEILPQAIDTLHNVLTQADFPQAAVAREKQRTLVGIRKKAQSPGILAQEMMYAALYRDHPYAQPLSGTDESIQALTSAQIVDFYQRYYVAENLFLVMVGALTQEDARVLADELTANISRGQAAPALPAVKLLPADREINIDFTATQTHVLYGALGLKRVDADYFPLYVGNHILGGGGMVSRLFAEIREQRGLSYSVYSYFSPMRYQGPFIAGLQTRAEKTEEATNVLQKNIQQFIETGPSSAELTASKRNIIGGFPLRIDSNSKRLDYVSMIALHGLPLDYLDTFVTHVNAVTVADIQDAFQRRMSGAHWVTVSVGLPRHKH